MKFVNEKIPSKAHYGRAYYAYKTKGYDAKGAVEYALQGDHRGVLRYNDMTVHKYCLKNNLSYSAVLKKIEEGLSIEEAIENTKYYTERMRRGISGNCRYLYKGKPVRQQLDDARYVRFLRRIRKGYTVEKAYKEVKHESD